MGTSVRSFTQHLNRVYAWYTFGFLVLIAAVAWLEQAGLGKRWIGLIFLLATVLVYAVIGMVCRTTDAEEYYVAGRRVPLDGQHHHADDDQAEHRDREPLPHHQQ